MGPAARADTPTTIPTTMPSAAVPGLTWRCHGDLLAAAGAWEALEAEGAARAFQSRAWAEAFVASHSGAERIAPRILVGTMAGVPRLLVPLALTARLGRRALVFLGEAWNDYNAPLLSPALSLPAGADAAALWREMATLAGPASVLEVAKQSPILADGRANPLLLPSALREAGSAHLLDLAPEMADPSWTGSGRTIGNLERKARKLARTGRIEIGCAETGPQAARAVAAMLAWKRGSLEARGAANPFEAASARAFLGAVAGGAVPAARTWTLTLDGAPIAVALCLVEGRNLILYQTAYDPAHARTSPGAQLIRALIRAAAGEGYATLDFCFGDDPYKDEICNRRVPLSRAVLPLGEVGRVQAAVTAGRIGLRRLVKENRVLYDAALSVNRRMRLLRTGLAGAPQREAGT